MNRTPAAASHRPGAIQSMAICHNGVNDGLARSSRRHSLCHLLARSIDSLPTGCRGAAVLYYGGALETIGVLPEPISLFADTTSFEVSQHGLRHLFDSLIPWSQAFPPGARNPERMLCHHRFFTLTTIPEAIFGFLEFSAGGRPILLHSAGVTNRSLICLLPQEQTGIFVSLQTPYPHQGFRLASAIIQKVLDYSSTHGIEGPRAMPAGVRGQQ